MSLLKTKIAKKISLSIILILSYSYELKAGEVMVWDCNKFENARIVGEDGTYLGKLGPSWMNESIFNSFSEYSSTWSSDSIFNDSSEFGNSYSNTSVFNDYASDPPKIISDSGLVGYLSIGPSWDTERFSPYDIKYTCNWD